MFSPKGIEYAEPIASFLGANSKDLKVAAQSSMRSQDQVWAKVREAQQKLGHNVGKGVENKDSPTSFQLTLEDKKLLEEVDKYVKELSKAVEGKKDVIGYAVAINGRVEAADVFGSNALFLKLWPKLINGSATEALAEKQKDKKFDAPTSEAVKTFLADAVKVTPELSPGTFSPIGGGFSDPTAVAVDKRGDVYVVDAGNHAVKRVPSGCLKADCVVTVAQMGVLQPVSVVIGPLGYVYVTSRDQDFKPGDQIWVFPP